MKVVPAAKRRAVGETRVGEYSVGEEEQETHSGRQIYPLGLSLIATSVSGAIFFASLFYQFALVEMAASLVTGFEVFFLSSAVADLIEREKTSVRRNSWAIVLAVWLAAFYCFAWYFR